MVKGKRGRNHETLQGKQENKADGKQDDN